MQEKIVQNTSKTVDERMPKTYLKTEQIVPGKGMSYTLFEVEGEDQILRMLTAIPDAGEVTLYPKPPVKKLFAPERCAASSEEEFEDFWAQGSRGDSER